MKNKVVPAADAIAIIRDGDTIAFSGFVGTGTPDELIGELEKRFLATGHPRDLTLVFAAAPGDGKDRGLNKLAHQGLVKRVVGGHWSLVPKLGAMAVANEIEAYNLPLGVISHLFRDIGAHRAGAITKVGLRTFVDPRLGGGRLNSRTKDALVRVMQIEGEEWLFYKAFPITVAFLRGTTSDLAGNITMEHEALILDNLAIATAAKNSGGFVIAQVERVCAHGALKAREVVVPGVMVDCSVIAQPHNHHQTYGTVYSPAFAGEYRVALDMLTPMPLDERKIIARRAAFELPMGGVVNLGIGMPEGVAAVANEERVLGHLTLTAEPGVIGGVPQSVNVSRFGPKLAGAGGFINISQNARKLVFVGTFTAGGLRVEVDGTDLVIVKEGRSRKFVKAVEQITFSGAYAAEKDQPVLYVTERCVFRRTHDGMELVEVAPGIDIERDILAQMDFKPIIRDPKPMDPRIFADETMQLDETLLGLGLAQRVSYDVERNTFFMNLEGMHVKTRDDVDRIRRVIEERVQLIGRKVRLVANYDQFRIDPSVADTYAAMVRYLETHYYETASRYTTSAFLRVKLGEALSRRLVKPHIFETREEAHDFVARHEDDGDKSI